MLKLKSAKVLKKMEKYKKIKIILECFSIYFRHHFKIINVKNKNTITT